MANGDNNISPGAPRNARLTLATAFKAVFVPQSGFCPLPQSLRAIHFEVRNDIRFVNTYY